MAANKRLYRYDVLRTIACVSIVVYHFDVESARNTPPRGFSPAWLVRLISRRELG